MKLKKYEVIGAVFTAIVGSLLHFTYEWSGNNPVVGAISAVNESTWEHLKLFVVPMIIFSCFEFIIFRKMHKNFVPVKLLSILIGMSTITVAFYTYKGVLGYNFLAADIGTFILGITAAYVFSFKRLKSGKFSSRSANIAGIAGTVVLVACIVLFTFYPPHIGLFKDPVSDFYGIR